MELLICLNISEDDIEFLCAILIYVSNRDILLAVRLNCFTCESTSADTSLTMLLLGGPDVISRQIIFRSIKKSENSQNVVTWRLRLFIWHH